MSARDFGSVAARRLEGESLARAWYAVWSLALTKGESPGAHVTIQGRTPQTKIVVGGGGREPLRHALWTDDGAPNLWPDELYSASSPAAPPDVARRVEVRAAESFVAALLWSTPGLLPERSIKAQPVGAGRDDARQRGHHMGRP